MKTLVLLLICCVPALAKTAPEMETAKVISQDIASHDGGYAMMPMGTRVVGVPIHSRSNVVIVETSSQRLTWAETGKSKSAIILPVHGTVNFYRDGDSFVVLDAKKKKHKFALIHMETLN
jgi:hypothetical protein